MIFIFSFCIPVFAFAAIIIMLTILIISCKNEKQQDINISKLVDYHWKKYYENQRKRLSYNKMQQYCEKNIN